MTKTNKLEILKHIKLGTSQVMYYPYNNGRDPLPLRPLSSFELDQCFYNALEKANEKVASLIIKLKLKMVDRNREINVSEEGYSNLLRFFDYVDYWIVFYAMKDFQEPEFSIIDFKTKFPIGFDIVLNMNKVHEIANFVLDSSRESEDIIKEILIDDYGNEIAQMVFYLNVPLATIKDITKLQRDYLIFAKTGTKRVKRDSYVVSGQTMTVKELLEKFK